MSATMQSIGQVAATTGMPVDTVRYYEKIGLLNGVPRDAAGRRLFGADELARLRFIRRAQSMNFSLAEIGELLALRDRPVAGRAEVRGRVQEKLEQIDLRIKELKRLRTDIKKMLEECQQGPEGPCPILERLSGH